jgi:cobalt-zinc-cadmium efflux system protein
MHQPISKEDIHQHPFKKETHHHPVHEAGSNLALAFWINLFFCIIEAIGGLLTNSMAILSDALHDLGDSFSLGLAWYMQKLSRRKPNQDYTYGYRRFTLLSALINAVILFSGSVFVLYESASRLFNPQETDAKGMLILAILGLIVNGYAAFRLQKGGSVNEKVVSLHMLEDVLGWAAVLIGSLIMLFANWPWIDPLLSVCISVFIIYNVIKNLRSAFNVLLQRKPDSVNEHQLEKALTALPHVQSLHDLHIWSLDNEITILTVHLVVDLGITKEAQQRLRSDAHERLIALGIQHATIEIEYDTETCDVCGL